MHVRLLATAAMSLSIMAAHANPIFTLSLNPLETVVAGTGSVNITATVVNTGTTDITGSGYISDTVSDAFNTYITNYSFTSAESTFKGIDLKPGQSVNFTFITESYAGLVVGLYANAVADAGITLTDATGGSYVTSASNTSLNVVTPEPSSLVLLGTGLLGLVGVARRRFA